MNNEEYEESMTWEEWNRSKKGLLQALTPPLGVDENSMRDGGLQGLPDEGATAERDVRSSKGRNKS